MVAPAVPEWASPKKLHRGTRLTPFRILEDQLQISVDTRTDALQTLRELGPPDLVHLIKQTNRTPPKQVRLEGSREVDSCS